MRVILALLVLLSAVPALAQTPTYPTIAIVNIYIPTNGTKVSATNFVWASLFCGLPKTTSTTATNPLFLWVDDPGDKTKDCKLSISGITDPLPDGTYALTAQYTYGANGTSLETAAVPFSRTRPVVLPAPTGVRLTQ